MCIDRVEMVKIVYIAPLVIALVGIFCHQVAYGENELGPDPSKSAAYNAGYSAGYLGLPLKGHHTNDFILGYVNGSSSYQVNRGEVEGYNSIRAASKNPDYISGYQQGVAERKAAFTKPTLPTHTDDSYKNFYIGYQDGQIQEDHD
jgi:hypothetical protein